MDAKTPITDEVFEKWKAEQVAAQRKEDEAKEEERRKKGIMTGREIFAQEGFIATDDASASDAYTREVDEEAEIKRMHKEAEEALAQARAQAAAAPPAAEPAGADGDGGAAAPAAVLTAEEEEDLFDDDDDDDEVLEALTGDLAKPGTLEEGAS